MGIVQTRSLVTLFALCAIAGCSSENNLETLEQFLNEYEAEYQRLDEEFGLAAWASNTRIVEGDTTNAETEAAAQQAYVAFVGSEANIDAIRGYLVSPEDLAPDQVLRLEEMLRNAAQGPQTIPDIVKERGEAEIAQNEKLYGFSFQIDGRPVTPNEIDDILTSSDNLDERLAAWEASKQVGPVLKDGIVNLRDLRNQSVQALGYDDYYQYQVSGYGMSVDEMLELNDQLIRELRPLYRELHTWARYELARRYGEDVPVLLPAHWLPNRWAQDWGALVNVGGLAVDDALEDQTGEWIVEQAEGFYQSLGFDPLPDTFWELSSLYPLPADSPYKKNTHASAWHLDLRDDVRSLMSVEPNAYWYTTAHHELGHIYYYMSYSRPEVPLVLRGGANRAYHEAIGSLIGLAASQRSFLVNRGLLDPNDVVDPMSTMLREAMQFVIFMPFASGTMTRFEHALYREDLDPGQFNQTWWDLVGRYQGVRPPSPRGEEWADALTKTHINDDPAQYYDYALAFALLFQMHDHIARELLSQDPHDTDYYGSRQVGDFLYELMSPGALRPWQEVLSETTGRGLDAQAMLDYFEPLYDWLQEQNVGREHTLPELD